MPYAHSTFTVISGQRERQRERDRQTDRQRHGGTERDRETDKNKERMMGGRGRERGREKKEKMNKLNFTSVVEETRGVFFPPLQPSPMTETIIN